jgi:mono/diheme cytochrome c family protein
MNGIKIFNTILCLSAAVFISMPRAAAAGEVIKITEDTLPQTQTATAATDSHEINLMPRLSESVEAEINPEPARATKAAGVAGEILAAKKPGRTEEIWLRLKSRFKTAEIETERKKYARASDEQTGEIDEYEDEEAAGGTAEALLESSGTNEVSASGEVKIKTKKTKKIKKGRTDEVTLDKKPSGTSEVEAAAKTSEVKIESGENLFYRRCYSCHFDHAHFKMAGSLAGKEFWLKYNENEAGIKKIIRSGFRTTAGDMPAYGTERLSDTEVEAIIGHLKSMAQPLKFESGTKTATGPKTEAEAGVPGKPKPSPAKETDAQNKNINSKIKDIQIAK